MSNIIQLHTHKTARAAGAFAAVNIAARRLGLSNEYAYIAACDARKAVLDGAGSAAAVVARVKAHLRIQAPSKQA